MEVALSIAADRPSMRMGTEYMLAENEMPKAWCNFLPDLPAPLPEIRDLGTPSAAEIAEKVRPKILIEQNQPDELWIDIPDPVADRLRQCGRPTPLRRALHLERQLDTPARIYFKREDCMTTGSFKLNTALAQAYYAAQEGRSLLVTETGAGQWGMSVALAATMFGLRSRVFMVRCSLDQKPYRGYFMELLGSEVHPSPSARTRIGSEVIRAHPDHPGSLGAAISEAIEDAACTPGAAYLSGSGMPHVYLHQTILGLEVKRQLAKAGEELGVDERGDHLIACAGGGSNLCGLVGPFLKDRRDGADIRLLAAESTAAPRLTAGVYQYGRSDIAEFTPEVLAYSMGKDFVPPAVHVGGLRNHHSSPIVSLLRREGILDARAFAQREALAAGRLLLETEGVLVAPEAAHAVAAAVEVALEARAASRDCVIVFLASGNGQLDLAGYHEVLGRTCT